MSQCCTVGHSSASMAHAQPRLGMHDFHDMQPVLQESGTWVHWQPEESREVHKQHTSSPQHALSLLLEQPVLQLQAGARSMTKENF